MSTGKDNLLNAWRTPYGASIFQVGGCFLGRAWRGGQRLEPPLGISQGAASSGEGEIILTWLDSVPSVWDVVMPPTWMLLGETWLW